MRKYPFTTNLLQICHYECHYQCHSLPKRTTKVNFTCLLKRNKLHSKHLLKNNIPRTHSCFSFAKCLLQISQTFRVQLKNQLFFVCQCIGANVAAVYCLPRRRRVWRYLRRLFLYIPILRVVVLISSRFQSPWNRQFSHRIFTGDSTHFLRTFLWKSVQNMKRQHFQGSK